MNAIAKNNSEHRLFIRDENYFKGLGVTLLGCHVRVFTVRYMLQGPLIKGMFMQVIYSR